MDLRAKGCNGVTCRRADPKESHACPPQGLIDESVASLPVRSGMGSVIQFHGEHKSGGARITQHKINMLLRNRGARPVPPRRCRAGDDVGEPDLAHDQIAVGDRRHQRPEEGGFAPRKQHLSIDVG